MRTGAAQSMATLQSVRLVFHGLRLPDPLARSVRQRTLDATGPGAVRRGEWRDHLVMLALPLGSVLYEAGDPQRHIYFPVDSIISLLYVLKDGASAEIAVVGNDGAIGVALFMGGETTTNRAIVQSAGCAYRLTS